MINNDIKAFDAYGIIVATDLPQTPLLKLADYGYKAGKPLLVLRIYGYIGYLRLVLSDHNGKQKHKHGSHPQ